MGSVFELRGRDENDLTAAFAYGIAKSKALCRLVLCDLAPGLEERAAGISVHIQTSRRAAGITDIELRVPGEAIIVMEAKRGSEYPSLEQLRQYERACLKVDVSNRLLVALTRHDPLEASPPVEWNQLRLPTIARSWAWVRKLVRRSIPLERRLEARFALKELHSYLEEFLGLDRIYSNMVYVVSLAAGNPSGWLTSWVDIVEKHGKYFYPNTKPGWPSPPGYIAFRYSGRLQSIHHVDAVRVVGDVRTEFPGTEGGEEWGSHYLLDLGPPIRPAHTVRAGPRVVRNNRVWCMLDTLLTASSVTQALELTKERIIGAEVSA